MTATLTVVTGTGTGIGKTHFAEALLWAWRARGLSCAGLKPIESGVIQGAETDASRLASASSFHVKPSGYAFPDPVSPHLAARRAGVVVSMATVVDGVDAARASVAQLIVELPGGLFSPCTDAALNADLAAALRPEAILLVAPDRLGVLHDLVATTRAARAGGLVLTGIILMAPESADASTGSNADELRGRVDVPVLAVFPRGAPRALATHAAMAPLVSPGA